MRKLNIIPLKLSLFLALLCLTTSSFAQKEAEPISLKYSVVVLAESSRQYDMINRLKWVLTQAEGREQHLSLALDRPTDLLRYSGPPVMRFYQISEKLESDSESAQVEEQRRLICSVPIASELQNRDLLIAIILPPNGQPLGIAFPLPDNMDTPGYAYTLNLSQAQVAAKINEKQGFIKPGDYFETDLNNIQHYKMRIDLAVEDKGTWQRVVSTATTATPDSRLLFLLYQSPTTGRWVQKKLALPEPVVTSDETDAAPE